jgi:hypothetical protein
MAARTPFVILILLAGCTTSSSQPVPSAMYAPAPGTTAWTGTTVYAAPAPTRTYGTRASDVALTAIATPFVLAFRAAVCATSAVVAGPAAAVFAVSDDPRGGFDYLRYGLARNCGPPYVVPVPVAARYERDPGLGAPRPLIPDGAAVTPAPVSIYAPRPDPGQSSTRTGSRVPASP